MAQQLTIWVRNTYKNENDEFQLLTDFAEHIRKTYPKHDVLYTIEEVQPAEDEYTEEDGTWALVSNESGEVIKAAGEEDADALLDTGEYEGYTKAWIAEP